MSMLLVFVLAGACEKDKIEYNDKALKVLFQYDYRNMAWGYSHSGWFIDNNGNVMEYNLPDSWRAADNLNYFDYDSLIYNYNQADTTVRQVDLDTLLKKSVLIENTLNGELSELDCHGADIGSMSYYCYYWDSEKKKFRKQLLSLSGDCDQINTTWEARELAEYLDHIGNLLK